MVNSVIKNTFETSYRDDWTDSDNFYRILFNNGRSLQARELTQMQTILQNQITQHANWQFKEGKPISGSGLAVNTDVEFVKLDTTVYELPTDTAPLVKDVFTGAVSGVKVRIDRVIPSENTDPSTLFVSYLDNNNQVAANTLEPIRLAPGETIVGATSGRTLKVQTTNTAINPSTGQGATIALAEGSWYIGGVFVYCPTQTLILSKYDSYPTADVGLLFKEEIITASDDTKLYDNSGVNPNLSAPGADRYKISVTLTLKSAIGNADAYINIAKILDGEIILEASQGIGDNLNVMGDVLAQRTHEESGNYIVNPFIINGRNNDSDEAFFDLTIGPGIAYVNGYRLENYGNQTVTIAKPRTTELVQNQVASATYGNYLNVENMKGVPYIGGWDILTLRSATGFGGIDIGTARVRSVEPYGSGYRLYIFDVTMDPGKNFAEARSIGLSYISTADIVLDYGVARTFDASNNNLLFDLPRSRPSEITDIILTTQRIYTKTLDGNGDATITASSGEAFDDLGSWIVAIDGDGEIISSPAISLGAGATSATINLDIAYANENITIAAYVQKNNAAVKSKTLLNRKITLSKEANGDVHLDRADIYRVTAIKLGSISGADLTNIYEVDNGQRDNFYDIGRLRLKANTTIPASNIYVEFDYFAHGAGGDFFAVNSYTGQIDYKDIPSHTQANGIKVPLRDVLDFRPRKDNTGINFTGTGASKVPLPRNTDLITFDCNYYQSLRGIIALDKNAGAQLYLGEPAAFNPQWPTLQPGQIDIYRFTMNPYMITGGDLSSKYIEYKRYTMADIAKLERRVDKIEEMTSLSLLEMETANLQIIDAEGFNRNKSGFTADPFKDHAFSATNSVEYHAAVDFNNRELRPSFVQRSIELVYDHAASTGTVLKGDTVYMDYTEEVWKELSQCSRDEAVTIFDVSTMVGEIKLSPSSDIWFDTETLPKKIIDGGVDLDVDNAKGWNNWNWNWSGWTDDELSRLKFGDSLTQTAIASSPRTYQSGRYTYTVKDRSNYINYIDGEYTVKESIGTFERTRTSIPYQRSKFIFFRATNLRPNTRFFAFYDGIDVSDFINGDTSFTQMGLLERTSPYLEAGNIYNETTEFPAALGGKSALYSNAVGEVEGVFLVPCHDGLRFAVGTNTFTLIDISILDPDTALSYAGTNFFSDGTLIKTQEEELRTRMLKVNGYVENIDPLVLSVHKKKRGLFGFIVAAIVGLALASVGAPVPLITVIAI